MGCDIHLYVEYKMNDHWFTILKNGFMPRAYRTFNALAGVRGEGAPVYPLRGFPSDDSAFTDASDDFFEYQETKRPCPDWHSATWLTPEEYRVALERVEDTPTEYWAILALCDVLKRDYKVRLIMWFDN